MRKVRGKALRARFDPNFFIFIFTRKMRKMRKNYRRRIIINGNNMRLAFCGRVFFTLFIRFITGAGLGIFERAGFSFSL